MFNDYFLSDKQKEKLVSILDSNEKKYQEELRETYNPDNIFKNKETINYYQINSETSNLNDLPIEVNENNILMKVIKYFKKIFHIDN